MNTLLELIANPYIISFALLAIIVMADARSAAARWRAQTHNIGCLETAEVSSYRTFNPKTAIMERSP